MALAIPVPLALGRFKQLPQRSNEVWQGAVVRFPMWVRDEADPEGPPLRPTGVLWVSLRTGLIHLDLAQDGKPVTTEQVLATFLEFGMKWARGLEGRPARVEVQDAGLRDSLAGPLASLNTTVTLVETPGHTPGTQSLLYPVRWKGRPYTIMQWGGGQPESSQYRQDHFRCGQWQQ